VELDKLSIDILFVNGEDPADVVQRLKLHDIIGDLGEVGDYNYITTTISWCTNIAPSCQLMLL